MDDCLTIVLVLLSRMRDFNLLTSMESKPGGGRVLEWEKVPVKILTLLTSDTILRSLKTQKTRCPEIMTQNLKTRRLLDHLRLTDLILKDSIGAYWTGTHYTHVTSEHV